MGIIFLLFFIGDFILLAFSLTEDLEERHSKKSPPPDWRALMTNEEKSQIISLRSSGVGYIKISQMLGVSNNTVRSFCRRNGLSGNSDESKTSCKQCGKQIRLIRGRKPRKFCSDRCRQEWWNSHMHEVKHREVYQYICQHCGKPFSAYGNKNRKYCSRACYIADRYGKPYDSHES